jgi:hypothetical protein
MTDARSDLKATIQKIPLFLQKENPTDARIRELSVGNYGQIRSTYELRIRSAIQQYLYIPNQTIATPKGEMTRSMYTAFTDAFETGWIDGGADLPTDEDAAGWLSAKQETEAGYISQLFQTLKEVKKRDDRAEFASVMDQKVQGYLATLDGVYMEGKLRGLGSGNVMATLDGDDGMESCPTCRKLKGKSHRVRWWVERGLIPGQPGNDNYECRGYNCLHYLYNSKTGARIDIWQ